MDKKIMVIVLVAIVVLGGGALVAVNHKSPKKAAGVMNMPSSKDNHPASSTPSATNSVTIDNLAFSPANIIVKAGTTVTWTNKDSASHTVQETDGQAGPASDSLATGKAYSYTYATAGTFKYHCSIHPDMVGTVTVTP